MSDQTLPLAVVLAIVIILLIIIVIAVVLSRPWIKTDIGLNQPCSDSKICLAGYSCESGFCKANPGTACTIDSDCGGSSIGCVNGICSTGLVPLEPPPNSEPVPGLTDVYDMQGTVGSGVARSCDTTICPSGQTCEGSIVLLNGLRTYQFGRNKVLDVTELTVTGTDRPEVLILLDSGAIMRDNNGTVTSVSNSVKLDRILMIGNVLAGTSDGTLYWLSPDNYSHSRWTWRIATWAPRNIVHVVTTLNGEWLWIQNTDPRESGSAGRLYRVGNNSNPSLQHTEVLDGRTFRYYGFTTESYVNIDPVRRVAFSSTQGLEQTIPNMVDGAVTSVDQILRITSESNTYLWSIRVFNRSTTGNVRLILSDNIYEIQNRLCT